MILSIIVHVYIYIYVTVSTYLYVYYSSHELWVKWITSDRSPGVSMDPTPTCYGWLTHGNINLNVSLRLVFEISLRLVYININLRLV